MRLTALLPLSALLLTTTAQQTLPTEPASPDNCPACNLVDTLPPCSPEWRTALQACQDPPCNRRYFQNPLIAAGCGVPDLSGTNTSTVGPDTPYPMPSFTEAPESTPTVTTSGTGSMSIPAGETPEVTGSMTIPVTTEMPSTTTTEGGNGTSPTASPTATDEPGSWGGRVQMSLVAMVPVVVVGLVLAA